MTPREAIIAGMARQSVLLRLVSSCPARGPVLPVSRQPECGMCGELSECRAGLGPEERRDAVTLDDCLACQGAMRQDSPPVR